jgi:hypothetical protein
VNLLFLVPLIFEKFERVSCKLDRTWLLVPSSKKFSTVISLQAVSVLQCMSPNQLATKTNVLVTKSTRYYQCHQISLPKISGCCRVLQCVAVCCSVLQWMSPNQLSTKTNVLVTKSTRYRVAKTHRMPYLYTSFSAKEPYN